MGIPYGKQSIGDDDIREVSKVLMGDFLTTGPKVAEFEEKFADFVGAKYGVAVSNGTAALHVACLVAGLKKEEELITSPMTFAASANCALYCGGKPVFVDVDEQGLIDIEKIGEKITDKTKVIIPVHYSGLACDVKKIREIAGREIIIIEDACHAPGSKYGGSKIGSCEFSDMCVFSFHPVKHITTGEGGMITTNSKELYEKLLLLRNHGITKDVEKMGGDDGGWFYEMQKLGFNYRITDIQCALGISQLKKLNGFIEKRREIAKKYDGAFKGNENIEILNEDENQFNVYHLYVVKLKDAKTRKGLYDFLKENEIFCQVHYIPVYWHPYYQKLGHEKGLCPNAEKFYERILSLPIYPDLKDEEQEFVIGKINEFFSHKKTGIIIQARMGATRLPNKVMLDLSGKPILWHVVERCKKANVDEVIVATSTNKENDVIEKFCEENGYSCFRGSEDDVLSRYYEAAEKFGLDIIIRVTADCPLIAPEIINSLIKEFECGDFDYVSNIFKRTFPRGFDVEIFNFNALEKAHNLCKEEDYREHVTAFMYGNPNLFKLKNIEAENIFYKPGLRLCIDTEKDLRLLRIIYNNLYDGVIETGKILKFLDGNSEFSKINLESEEDQMSKNKEQNIKQEKIDLVLSLANEEDCRDFYLWRNHPLARKFSRNTKEKNYREHVRWFKDSLKNPDRKIYVGLDNGVKVGQIRFDKEKDGKAEVSVTVAHEKWGKGYGTILVLKGSEKYLSEEDVKIIRAEIKKEHVASKRIFEKAGYEFIREFKYGVEDMLEMRLKRQIEKDLDKNKEQNVGQKFLDNKPMKILILGYKENKIIDFLRERGDEIIVKEEKLSLSDIEKINPDFIISYGYRYIIQPDVIEKYPNIVNLHISYLPWNKGVDPNFWSWLENTPKGYTIHYIAEGIDTGDILLQGQTEFVEDETLASSYEKLKTCIENLFIKNWKLIVQGEIKPKKQNLNKGNLHYIKDLKKYEFLLGGKQWETPVEEIKEYGRKNNLWMKND